MIHESVHEINLSLQGIVGVTDKTVDVLDADRVRNELIDTLLRDAVFGSTSVSTYAKWLIWELGQQLNAQPASIHVLYMARARGEYTNMTVPAMNLRMMSYDMIRTAMRAAKKNNVAAIIFELARSEMAFSFQGPDEYSACVIAAAIRERYTNPLFIQGDHFQVNPKVYAQNPTVAIQEVKELIKRSIPAGFWSIDIDTSTLVTLEPESLVEQQQLNFEHSAELTAFIRSLEPETVAAKVGYKFFMQTEGCSRISPLMVIFCTRLLP
ncbi:class II fructose-bisphosphate aldolase [Chloroflexi bacterium TSY]|nr:class II fructose-bisphosphate aldolase [Chloroflexi bacterium TSY]